MELGAILEPGDAAKAHVWYVLSPDGQAPSPRVGQSCIALRRCADGKKGTTVIVVAGANPREIFTDTYRLFLGATKFNWEDTQTTGLRGRYEHACAIDEGSGDVMVFGGANLSENLSDIQVLKSGFSEWETILAKGQTPIARTCHNNSSLGADIILFSGGMSGANPITDTQVHRFIAGSRQWHQTSSSGDIPSPRQGHAMCSVGKSVFLHGGMNGSTIHDDCYLLNTEAMHWEQLVTQGAKPSGRASHAIAENNGFVFIFGGLNETGALDDLFYLDMDSLKWTQVMTDMFAPAPRLDHSMVIVQLPCSSSANLCTPQTEQSLDADKKDTMQTCLLVFGGMDTAGQIFNDCLVMQVDHICSNTAS